MRAPADQAARQSQLLLGHSVLARARGLAPVTGPLWLVVRAEVPPAQGDSAVRQARVWQGHSIWVRAMRLKAMRLLTLVSRQFELARAAVVQAQAG